MGTASLHLANWNALRRRWWEKVAPRCGFDDCVHRRNLWRRWRRRARGLELEGVWYCLDHCLERALARALGGLRAIPERAAPAHRIPLGLLMLSRQQITAEQLRHALEVQRAAGRGKIGEWLKFFGFATDEQVTAALARQWSCPILRGGVLPAAERRIPQMPLGLLEAFAMIPVDYIPATATLHVAFSERIDYTVLYALEQMLGCHTEPCLVVPGVLRRHLQGLLERRRETEVVFDCLTDTAEFGRIIRSYAARVGASELRLAGCGPHLWARLLRPARAPLDLLLRSSRGAIAPDPASQPSAYPAL